VDSSEGESVMIPTHNKKSPRTAGRPGRGDHGRKRGLNYIFAPARRGSTHGPFSFEIVTQAGR
jgi:hypothetical protein